MTILILSFCCNGEAPSLIAAEQDEKESKISLIEVAPEIQYAFRRYPKFYGDENTRDGDLFERSYLLGNLGGVRDTLVDHGIYLDVSVTQFLQGNVSGGKDGGSARYNGTADYWLTLDTGKAGLWSGGAIFLLAESSWQADYGRQSVKSILLLLLACNPMAMVILPASTTLTATILLAFNISTRQN